jgi:hypothetical protein
MVVFISLFLPWFGFSALGASFTVDGLTAHGYLYLALILALAVVAYLLLRAGWDEPPLRIPVAHEQVLLVGSGLQFLFVLIAFIDKPLSILSWEIGSFLALLAAAAAVAPGVITVVRAWQGRS